MPLSGQPLSLLQLTAHRKGILPLAGGSLDEADAAFLVKADLFDENFRIKVPRNTDAGVGEHIVHPLLPRSGVRHAGGEPVEIHSHSVPVGSEVVGQGVFRHHVFCQHPAEGLLCGQPFRFRGKPAAGQDAVQCLLPGQGEIVCALVGNPFHF